MCGVGAERKEILIGKVRHSKGSVIVGWALIPKGRAAGRTTRSILRGMRRQPRLNVHAATILDSFRTTCLNAGLRRDKVLLNQQRDSP